MSDVTLNQYGSSFQSKIIASLISSKAFLEQIQDILEDSYFESDANKWLVREIKKYHIQYKNSPTLEALKVLVNDVKSDVLKVDIVEKLRTSFTFMESPDLDFVQSKTLDFCKNQCIKEAILNSVDLLPQGNYEGIKTLIDAAMKAGSEKDVGHIYFDMFEDRYSETARVVTETPWDIINDITSGGLGQGELGVVVAPAGVGKTWVLAAVGAAAVEAGKKVVHYSLELNEAYVGLRYDSIFTGIANQNLKYHKDDIQEKLTKFSEDSRLTIKYFPTKTASVQTIAAHLQRLITLGDAPDLVVVDYADIMRDTGGAREVRHALGNIYEDLRGLAGEIGVPIWTASQANRSALDDDVIEAQKVSESYAKIMTADFVMSLSRKVEDKIANTGRVHVIKNRFGPDGMTFPANVNTNNGSIKVYESTTDDGKQQQKKIDNHQEFVRKSLAQKYKDMG